jgi:hypothetical protein
MGHQRFNPNSRLISSKKQWEEMIAAVMFVGSQESHGVAARELDLKL